MGPQERSGMVGKRRKRVKGCMKRRWAKVGEERKVVVGTEVAGVGEEEEGMLVVEVAGVEEEEEGMLVVEVAGVEEEEEAMAVAMMMAAEVSLCTSTLIEQVRIKNTAATPCVFLLSICVFIALPRFCDVLRCGLLRNALPLPPPPLQIT